MQDGFSDAEPLPAVPLEYASRDDESLRFVLRMIATLFVLWQLALVSTFISDFVFYLCERNDPAIGRKLLRWVPLAIATPRTILALYVVVNSGSILKLTTAGRRWIMFASIAQAGLTILTEAGFALDLVVNRRIFFYGPAYGLSYVVHYCLAGILNALCYAVMFSTFRTRVGST